MKKVKRCTKTWRERKQEEYHRRVTLHSIHRYMASLRKEADIILLHHTNERARNFLEETDLRSKDTVAGTWHSELSLILASCKDFTTGYVDCTAALRRKESQKGPRAATKLLERSLIQYRTTPCTWISYQCNDIEINLRYLDANAGINCILALIYSPGVEESRRRDQR